MSGPGTTSDDLSFAQIIGEMEEELAHFDRVAGAEVYYGPEEEPKPKPKAPAAPAPAPSWWSQHGGELTKGVLDVAAPWIQTGLTKAGLPPAQRAAPPPPPMQLPPPAKTTNYTPWLIGGGVVLGLGMLVLLLRRK